MGSYEDANRGIVLVPALTSVLALTSIFVAMRFYTRAVLTSSLSWDDAATAVGFVLTFAEGILMMVHGKYGQGRHWDTLSPAYQTKYLQIFYATLVIYYMALGIIKTAILLQYLRIFTGKMRTLTIWCIIIFGMWSTGIWLVAVNACAPIRAYWDKTVDGHCVPNLPQWYINAAGNIFSDIVIAVLPIRALWNLHLPRSQRLSLIGVFALGFFTCAISVIRITVLSLDSDLSYKNIAAAIWSISELACALITSSLPTLRPILYRILPRVFKPSMRSSHNQSNAQSGYASHSMSIAHHDKSTINKELNGSTEELTYHPGDIEMHASAHRGFDNSSELSDSEKNRVHVLDEPHRGYMPNNFTTAIVTAEGPKATNIVHQHQSSVAMGGITVQTETVVREG